MIFSKFDGADVLIKKIFQIETVNVVLVRGPVDGSISRISPKRLCHERSDFENDEFFDRLYSKFNIQRVQTIHSINSDGEGRELINEIIVSNY